MSELNTVCISTDKYDHLMQCKFESEVNEAAVNGLTNYIERLEKVVIDYIKKASNHGAYDWKLREEFGDIITVMNAHNIDWTEDKPEAETEELIVEIDEGYQE